MFTRSDCLRLLNITGAGEDLGGGREGGLQAGIDDWMMNSMMEDEDWSCGVDDMWKDGLVDEDK